MKILFPNSLQHTNRWNSQSQNMFCYFFPFSQVIVQKIANYCWSLDIETKFGNRSGDIFCSENEKWAIIQELFNIIDFLVNSGLSGRGPAWSKILQCRDFGRSCSICSKLDDCESLLTKQNVEVLFIINISDMFLVIMPMMFMLMMRMTMMVNKSLREVAKAQQEMSFKIYFANYLRIKR